MKKQQYQKYADTKANRSSAVKNSIIAFIAGGLVCLCGKGIVNLYTLAGLSDTTAATMGTVTLIFIAGLLTGIGIFDDIARVAGAGVLVPITGFANSMAAPAIESKKEGAVLGIGTQMFVIAGPVLVYGNICAVLYGIIYYICKKAGL